MPKNIYLLRHAYSFANENPAILHKTTNISVGLTPLGITQAHEAANKILELALTVHSSGGILKIWNSPYNRTRQTAHIVKELLNKSNVKYLEEESIYLGERQLGLIDDNQNHLQTHAPEQTHYQLHKKENKDFFVRPPLGESYYDVAIRADFFLKNYIEKEVLFEEQEVTHLLISHAGCIKALCMMQAKWPYEKCAATPNPANASITKISGKDVDMEWFKPKTKSWS